MVNHDAGMVTFHEIRVGKCETGAGYDATDKGLLSWRHLTDQRVASTLDCDSRPPLNRN